MVDPNSEDKVHVAVDGLGGKFVVLYVGKKEGMEKEKLLAEEGGTNEEEEEDEGGLWSRYILEKLVLKPRWSIALLSQPFYICLHRNCIQRTYCNVQHALICTCAWHKYCITSVGLHCCVVCLGIAQTFKQFLLTFLCCSGVSAFPSLSFATACLGRRRSRKPPTRWLPMRGSTSSPLLPATSMSASFAS